MLGLEAEFTLLLDGVPHRPERVFGSPQRLIRQKMLPRTGRSFQLPAGGAIYFDTGVIEVATPIIEVEEGCCYRATRLLWEQIRYLRRELDAWGKTNGRQARLQGFSAHYNFSFPKSCVSRTRNASGFARLLAHLLPIPVIVLGANRRSTAAGIRQRGQRIEITADFTPDPALMLATCAFIAGIFEVALSWDHYRLTILRRKQIPQLQLYRLRKHSSRKGERILADSLAHDPFLAQLNDAVWPLRDGRTLSLRDFCLETLDPFRAEIARLSDRETLHHIEAVFAGKARSLLDFDDRPSAYDNVGREFSWNRRRLRRWSRSAYERVIHRVIRGEAIRVGGKRYLAQRMQGWYEIVFREVGTGERRVMNLDELLALRRRK